MPGWGRQPEAQPPAQIPFDDFPGMLRPVPDRAGPLPIFEDHDREDSLSRAKRMNQPDDFRRSRSKKNGSNMRNSKFFKFLKFFLTKKLRGYIFQPNWQQGRWLHRYLLYIGRVLALGQTDFALEGVRVHHTPPSES